MLKIEVVKSCYGVAIRLKDRSFITWDNIMNQEVYKVIIVRNTSTALHKFKENIFNKRTSSNIPQN